jgi:predicted O-methyltransferase YrrM
MPDLSEIEGFLSIEEAIGLFSAAKSAGPGVLEIGTFKGRSTIALAAGRKMAGASPVYTVDHGHGSAEHKGTLPEEGTWREALRNLERMGVLGWVVPVMLDSLRARIALDDMRWSLVFIDGGHDRLSVLTDAALWLPRIRPEGLIAFHDYSGAGNLNVVPTVDALKALMALEPVGQAGSITFFRVLPGKWV